jgi:SH3-like domain-containing protein
MKVKSIIILLLIVVFAGVANAERLTVSAPVANIRSGPGTSHNVLWKVEQYFPILVIEKSGEWYRFEDFEGDKGWVHPGTNHPVLFSVEKGIPFKVLKRENNWIHIEHADGDKGWIHKSLVW